MKINSTIIAMKKLTLFLVLLGGLYFLNSCNAKKEADASETEHAHHAEDDAREDWTEMDDFHMIMAEAFHPYKDSANLAPAKAIAAEMAANAAKWAEAPLPERVNNDEVKNRLLELKSGAASFEQLVTTGTDQQVGEALTKLHDQFHDVQEYWYGGGHDHH